MDEQKIKRIVFGAAMNVLGLMVDELEGMLFPFSEHDEDLAYYKDQLSSGRETKMKKVLSVPEEAYSDFSAGDLIDAFRYTLRRLFSGEELESHLNHVKEIEQKLDEVSRA